MIRQQIKLILVGVINRLAGEGFLGSAAKEVIDGISVEYCKESAHGDYATGAAMQLAGGSKTNAIKIAERIMEEITKFPKAAKIFSKVEVVPPGFINFTLAPEFLQLEIVKTLNQGNDFGKVNIGKVNIGKNKKTQVEFISANPSGMLHIGNGRNAFYGDALVNVLESAGYDVEREYYINDAKVSKQIQELGKTAKGLGISYLSPYLEILIKKLHPRLAKMRSQTDAGYFLSRYIMMDLKKTITKDLGIKFDAWISEQDLYEKGLVVEAYNYLKKIGLVYEKEDAYWLNMAQFDQKDEVLLRHDGSPTYFLSDIAYHYSKIKRGYKKIIDIWGADHQGHVPRMEAVMKLFKYKGDFEVLLCQMVSLKGGKISKRTGNIISVNELIKEVGLDAVRFFYLQPALSSQMDFDIDLAKKKSRESPVFYAQYAYARIISVLRKTKRREIFLTPGILKNLQHQSEIDLMKEILRFPEIIEDTARDYQIQRVCQYLLDLATRFHKFYDDCRVISQDAPLTDSRLALTDASKLVLGNTFGILGISIPKRM